MEQVMWFFADENNNKLIAQTLMGVNEEEQAIDTLSLQVPKGRYILGYFRNDGTQKVYRNSRQIVS